MKPITVDDGSARVYVQEWRTILEAVLEVPNGRLVMAPVEARILGRALLRAAKEAQ